MEMRIPSGAGTTLIPNYMRKVQSRPGYEHVNMHMIFDIKMDVKFTRKTILMSDGNTIAPPPSIAYSSVVSRVGVRISFIPLSLNYLDKFPYNIGNAYLNSKCKEKIWTKVGT